PDKGKVYLLFIAGQRQTDRSFRASNTRYARTGRRPRSVHSMVRSDSAPSEARLMVSGIRVPSNVWAITVPMPIDMKVVSEPMTAEATPAIWPSGSIARALKLPNKIPKQKKSAVRKTISDQKGGTPPV